MLRKTTPAPSTDAPGMPLRIGKRHDPDDAFFMSRKPPDPARGANAGPKPPSGANGKAVRRLPPNAGSS